MVGQTKIPKQERLMRACDLARQQSDAVVSRKSNEWRGGFILRLPQLEPIALVLEPVPLDGNQHHRG
jgi:hypothetical protein